MPCSVSLPPGSRLNAEADLSEADLSGVNLSGVDLSGVDLSGANLSGANLSGTNLSDANLQDTLGVTNEDLEKQALSLEGAIMPDGSAHD